MKKKSLSVLVIILVAGFVAGGVAGYFRGLAGQDSYAVHLSAVKADFPSAPDIHEFSGIVTATSAGSLTLKTSLVGAPWEPPLPAVRIVSAGSATQILQSSVVMPKVKVGSAVSSPPVATLKPIPLSDIVPGDIVDVSADQNIKFASSFIASKIMVTGHTSL